MPVKPVPISNQVLAWAISESGLSITDVAAKSSVDVSDVQNWLNNESKPSTGELTRLAKTLNRSPSFFLRPRPPQKVATQVSLRVPYGERGERSLTPDERVHIRRALSRQKIAKWASTVSPNFSRPTLPTATKSPEDAAENARKWLDWSVHDQFSAVSKSAVARAIRLQLEARNILVIQLSMGNESCRGLSVHDDRVPLIVYNSSDQTAAARSFTMLHELAHLMHGEDVVCGSVDSVHERWCDRFAAAFFMPASSFLEELAYRIGVQYVSPTDVGSVKKLADRFKVSYQSVALRLWHLRAADYALFEHIRDGRIEDRPGFARGGAETPEVRLREYGTGYARLLLDAYESSALSEIDVRKYLNVNGLQLAAISEIVSEAR